jgi:hypothetical protein
MVHLSGTSPFFDPVTATGGSGTLRVQLNEVERQLSDCLHCDSSNTAEGRARIQRLQGRAQALKDRLEAQAAAQREASKRGSAGGPASAVAGTQPPTSPPPALQTAPSYASDGAFPSLPGSRLDFIQ